MTPPLAPAEPAKRLTVNATENGWILDAHPESGPPFDGSGLAGTRYVYTDADELAAAVRGLVERGEPLKTAKQLGYTIYGATTGRFSADPSSPVLESKILNAYRNGRDAGTLEVTNTLSAEFARLSGDIKRLTADNQRLSELATTKNTDVENLRQALKTRYADGLAAGRNETKGRQPWKELELAQGENVKLNERLAGASVVNGVLNANLMQARAELRAATNELDAERRRLQDEVRRTESPDGAPSHPSGEQVIWGVDESPLDGVRVGDCFYTEAGTPVFITSTSPEIRAVHYVGEKKSSGFGPGRYTLRAYVGSTATRTRGDFSPANFPGEPAEGFRVGDVWEVDGRVRRTILTVSDNVITYQQECYHVGRWIDVAAEISLRRPDKTFPWNERVGESRLIRK